MTRAAPAVASETDGGMDFMVHNGPPVTVAPPLNVILAIPNDLQRYGIEGMLQSLDIVDRCSALSDLAAAVEAVQDPDTHILLTTLNAADPAGEAALRRAAHRGVRILLLSGADEESLGHVAVLPGVSLLLPEDLGVATLRDALITMAAGHVHIPAALTRTLLSRAGHGERRGSASPRLTPREQETLVLLVDGFSNKQIARRLHISEHGAKRLVANILAKLNCPNRTLAAARALREGLCVDRVASAGAFASADSVLASYDTSGK